MTIYIIKFTSKSKPQEVTNGQLVNRNPNFLLSGSKPKLESNVIKLHAVSTVSPKSCMDLVRTIL